MSVLAIRFGHKSLLMTGILLQIISATGAFLAPTFLWLLAFFALEGVGSVLSGVAFVTLIGDFLPQNRKAKAVSYIAAALSLATFAGTRLIPIAAGLGTWRYSYLLLGLPFAVAALAVSHFGIPSRSHEHKPEVSRKEYLRSFKHVFLNKSAAACLVASLFFTGTIGLFAIKLSCDSNSGQNCRCRCKCNTHHTLLWCQLCFLQLEAWLRVALRTGMV